jgi:hypothetical protein
MISRSALLTSALAWVCGVSLACGCGSSSGNNNNTHNTNTPRTETPAELQGDWKHGVISFTNFWDDQGQYVGNAGGIGVYFTFQKDGSYKQFLYINQRSYNCVTQTWTETNGTTVFEAGKFTVHPTVGHYKASDSCVDRNNFERPMTAQEIKDKVQVYLWKFETRADDGKTWLKIGFDEQTWNYFDQP